LFLSDGKAFHLLRRLRALQSKYDPKGILRMAPEADMADLAMAMTLRDTTMFVKLSGDGADVRLGDLDPKSGDSVHKVQQWRDIEADLITEGWYAGDEAEQLQKGEEKHTSCMLWTE
jgi:hypothetical protein